MTKRRRGILILLMLVGIARSTVAITLGEAGSPRQDYGGMVTVSLTQLTFNAVIPGSTLDSKIRSLKINKNRFKTGSSTDRP